MYCCWCSTTPTIPLFLAHLLLIEHHKSSSRSFVIISPVILCHWFTMHGIHSELPSVLHFSDRGSSGYADQRAGVLRADQSWTELYLQLCAAAQHRTGLTYVSTFQLKYFHFRPSNGPFYKLYKPWSIVYSISQGFGSVYRFYYCHGYHITCVFVGT